VAYCRIIIGGPIDGWGPYGKILGPGPPELTGVNVPSTAGLHRMSQRCTDTSDRIHDSLPLSISDSGIVFQPLTMAGTLLLLWTFA